MKKYIFALSLFLGGLFVSNIGFAANDPSYESWSNKSQNIGSAANPVRVMKLVRLANTGINATSVVSGDALIYDIVSSDDGVTVRRTTTSADGAFAGIAACTILTADTASTSNVTSDLGKRNWGWIIVHGPANTTLGAGAANGRSAGEAFITSTDSSVITGYTTTNDAIGYQRGGHKGFFMGTPTASTDCVVFVENE